MHMALKTKRWTLPELHSLPDDGNKYELVRGELFVTPAPTYDHETIAARLGRVLDRYAEEHGLGFAYRPRSVMRFEGSEVEPDLMVRAALTGRTDWENAPTPLLVVEIHSPTTRRRDNLQKRTLYLEAGVDEYWMVDPEQRTITAIRADETDVVAADRLEWSPKDASEPLSIDVAAIFA